MSKHCSIAAFLFGEIIGAAAVYFTCTENGREILKKGIDRLDEFVSKKDKNVTDGEPQESMEE